MWRISEYAVKCIAEREAERVVGCVVEQATGFKSYLRMRRKLVKVVIEHSED